MKSAAEKEASQSALWALRLPPSMLTALRAAADERGVSMSAIVRAAVDEWLTRAAYVKHEGGELA